VHIEVRRNSILAQLNQVGAIVSSKSTLPVARNVKLVAENGTLKLIAFNVLNYEITIPVDGEDVRVLQEGEMLLPTAAITNILKSVGKDTVITLFTEERSLEDGYAITGTLKFNRSRFKFDCMPAQDFPDAVPVTPDFTLNIGVEELRDGLKRVAFTMPQSDVRYYLNGLCIDYKSSKLNLVATDGHRLSLFEVEPDKFMASCEESGGDFQVIIPFETVNTVIKSLKNAKDESNVVITSDVKRVTFEVEDVKINSPVLDGLYPEYISVFPMRTNMCKFTFNATGENGLNTCLKQALAAFLSVDLRKNNVVLTFSDNAMLLTSKVGGTGSQSGYETSIPVDYPSQEELVVSVNGTYLSQILDNAIDETLVMEVANNETAFVFYDPNCATNLHVVMPVRL